MREILFRGKRVDDGEWIEGYYVKSIKKIGLLSNPTIITVHQIWYDKNNQQVYLEVIPETVGEYTGLTDKNGKKIFEGDKVISEYGTIGIVEWDNEECSFLVNIGDDYQMLTDSEYVVISNIYDNSELLQEDKQ